MARILHGYDCGIGQKLQLQFDPWSGNFPMPQDVALKKKKFNKKKQTTNKQTNKNYLTADRKTMPARLATSVMSYEIFIQNSVIMFSV